VKQMQNEEIEDSEVKNCSQIYSQHNP